MAVSPFGHPQSFDHGERLVRVWRRVFKLDVGQFLATDHAFLTHHTFLADGTFLMLDRRSSLQCYGDNRPALSFFSQEQIGRTEAVSEARYVRKTLPGVDTGSCYFFFGT
jgi:hypothetical protein